MSSLNTKAIWLSWSYKCFVSSRDFLNLKVDPLINNALSKDDSHPVHYPYSHLPNWNTPKVHGIIIETILHFKMGLTVPLLCLDEGFLWSWYLVAGCSGEFFVSEITGNNSGVNTECSLFLRTRNLGWEWQCVLKVEIFDFVL